jgi:hypothetical protein
MADPGERTNEVSASRKYGNFLSDSIDLGIGLRLERPTFLCLLTSNRFIPIKNKLG